MTITSALYKTTYATGQGLKSAFKWACGEKSLEDRGLKRRDTFGVLVLGEVLGCAGFVTIITLAPPLALAFAGVATAVAIGMAPAALQAAYLIGKDDSEKMKAQKLT